MRTAGLMGVMGVKDLKLGRMFYEVGLQWKYGAMRWGVILGKVNGLGAIRQMEMASPPLRWDKKTG
jgi:hypothetical protein